MAEYQRSRLVFCTDRRTSHCATWSLILVRFDCWPVILVLIVPVVLSDADVDAAAMRLEMAATAACTPTGSFANASANFSALNSMVPVFVTEMPYSDGEWPSTGADAAVISRELTSRTAPSPVNTPPEAMGAPVASVLAVTALRILM